MAALTAVTYNIWRHKMPWPKIKQEVFDKCTNTVCVIEESTPVDIDGVAVRMFRLSGAPVTPNYPDGWRHNKEISTSKILIKAAKA